MKTALIGLGMVSGTFADAIQNSPDITLKSVYARNPDSRAAFLAKHPALGATAADSVEAIAADPTIDFVILATPPNARADIIDVLVAAGKPILMEKPVERTLAAATAIVAQCEAANVPLGIVLQHRARPIVATLREKIPALGTLISTEVNIPWWRPQSYYDAPGRGTYARDGGGVLLSQGIHTLDLMLSLTGAAAEVTAMTATSGFHQMESEDFVCAGVRFVNGTPNGAVGQIFASTASFPGRGETIVLNYTNGSALLEPTRLTIDWQDGRHEETGTSSASGAGADPMAFTSDWHRFLIEDFAQVLKTGGRPIVSGREALTVHRLIAALEHSGRSGTRVVVEQS
jgi:predicted dehydrogenase